MKRFFVFLLLLAMFITTLVFSVSANTENNDDKLTIIFTHDLHSHLSSFKLDGKTVGGFARIKSYINSVKGENENTLVVDAGDFSMGTLYQSIFQSHASEYLMLSDIGYDAITFGNHEFDYGFDALRKMIETANSSGAPLSPIISSNIDANAMGLSENDLKSLHINEYVIINKGVYDIAVIGLLGKDAVELVASSDSSVVFEDYIKAAKESVAEIKNLYSPDLILCISHSGTGDSVKDEDVALAKAVPDIDVIISGHTHSTHYDPLLVGDTVIASCGEYGANVGRIDFKLEDGNLKFSSYELTEIDTRIPEDPETAEKVTKFKAEVNKYLDKFGYKDFDEVIAYSAFDFPEQSEMSSVLAEQQLGNLISDSYKYALELAEGDNYVNVDVAVVPSGVIRSSIDKGDITVSQIYEISSLGIGNDGVSGYPLCSVYLYGWELWNLAEVDASVSGIMPYAQLYCSGLGYSINKNRMFMNKVYDCWLIGSNGERIEIQEDKLYRVVSGITSAKMLGTVKSKSFGLLELTPKDENGNEITDFNSRIAYDSKGAELKEWKALADYVSSFEKNEKGISVIPNRYQSLEGRKNISTKFNLSEIFVRWNFVSWIVFSLTIILISVIILVPILVIRKRRKKLKNLIVESEEGSFVQDSEL